MKTMTKNNIAPKKSYFKKMAVSIGFYALGRGTESVSRFNKEVKKELAVWPNGFTIMLKIAPNGSEIWLQKSGDKINMVNKQSKEADLIVYFKNLDTMYRIILTLNNVHTAFSQNRIMVSGDLSNAMVLIRILNKVQSYLFPSFLSKNVLKRVPKFTIGEYIGRIRLYTLGLAIGR